MSSMAEIVLGRITEYAGLSFYELSEGGFERKQSIDWKEVESRLKEAIDKAEKYDEMTED